MTNILVTGANGQLGSEIKALSEHYAYRFFFTDASTLDICDKKTVETYVSTHKIDTIINCAAYTAVDKAESEEALAHNINHTAVSHLSEIAKIHKLSLIHISTDYVFNGENFRPYVEDDAVAPTSVYGESKYKGEASMQAINPSNSLIIRTSWVYSSYGQNFVKTMLRLGKEKESLGVIFDQIGTPTYARDLAKTILDILPQVSSDHVEIYHYSNEGVASWFDFAKAIMHNAKLSCQVTPIESSQYPTPASRPFYSLLNKNKIKNKFHIAIPHWKDSLNECLVKIGENNNV